MNGAKVMKINNKLDYIRDERDDFKTYLNKAVYYGFRCIFARSKKEYDYAKKYLENTSCIIAGAIDFPEGIMSLDEKLAAFENYAEIGFHEIDYVLNQRNVENGNLEKIEEEMNAIHKFCVKHDIREKVIVEMCKLDGRDDLKREICLIAKKIKPAFLKTSTGRSFKGADINDVRIMKSILGNDVKIKASGGIRTYQQAIQFFNAGVSIIGASGAIKIIEGENIMFNFDEKKVYTDHLNGVNMIPQVEKVVDKICEDGYKNIFLVGIGGTLLYAGQIFHTARQLGCSLPLYLTNATDFLYEGDANFTKDSVVVVASLSGHTVEVEQAIDKAHEVGARVIGYVEVVDTPIANKVDELVTTVGGEYYWWYTVVLRFMKNAGQFDKYDELVSDMQNLPKDIVQVYKDADAQMKEYADKYCDSPLTYLVASGNLEDWAHCYGMCIMEEMQWMRTRPISAANFFHGLLEVIERDTTVLLIKGEDKTRPEMDRVENFVGKICANVTTIDTKNFELPGIRDEFRGILSPIVMRSAFMRLNVHLEHNRRHPLDIRRYYKCLDY